MPFLSPTSAMISTGPHPFFNHKQAPEERDVNPFYVCSQTSLGLPKAELTMQWNISHLYGVHHYHVDLAKLSSNSSNCSQVISYTVLCATVIAPIKQSLTTVLILSYCPNLVSGFCRIYKFMYLSKNIQRPISMLKSEYLNTNLQLSSVQYNVLVSRCKHREDVMTCISTEFCNWQNSFAITRH